MIINLDQYLYKLIGEQFQRLPVLSEELVSRFILPFGLSALPGSIKLIPQSVYLL
jgi:hypothetical protein